MDGGERKSDAVLLGGVRAAKKNLGHGIASAVAVPCAGTDLCVVAHAAKDLAAQGALRVSGEKRDAEAVLQSRSDEVGKRREAGSPESQPLLPGPGEVQGKYGPAWSQV